MTYAVARSFVSLQASRLHELVPLLSTAAVCHPSVLPTGEEDFDLSERWVL